MTQIVTTVVSRLLSFFVIMAVYIMCQEVCFSSTDAGVIELCIACQIRAKCYWFSVHLFLGQRNDDYVLAAREG